MDSISHTSAAGSCETVIALQPGLDGNSEQRDLERKFVQAFKLACSTTCMGQTFYGREFERAHSALQYAAIPEDAADQAVQTGDPELAFEHLAAFFDELKQTGSQGLSFRLWRDGISLVTSVALLATMAGALMSQQERSADDFSAANHPIGTRAADLVLVFVEGCKMLVTTSLSYPTLKRHHLVDEFLKRMKASVTLLTACLEEQVDRPPFSFQQCALHCIEKGRDVATVFTLLNTALSAVRSVLWSIEGINAGTGLASWRGVLRLTQNLSDSIRSVFSTIGTAARAQCFKIELEQLKTALPALREQFRHGNGTQVLPQLEKMALLFSVCSTPLLSHIAASPPLIAEFKNTRITSPEALRKFLTHNQIAFVVAKDDKFLHNEAPENQWGERLVKGAYQCTLSELLRAPYRLTLETQHQMSRPSESIVRH